METRGIDPIGLVDARDIIDGCVVRMSKADPVYDDDYRRHLGVIRAWLANLRFVQMGAPDEAASSAIR